MRIWVIGRRESARMLALIGVILAVLFFGGNFFRGVQATAASKRQLPIYSVEREGKTISLGINCAWDNADIPQLLDILDKAGVKATFFVVGQWCDKYPESVKAIGDAGHEIGNHSDRHKDMTKLDRAGIVEEIENASDKVEKITGTRPKLFRAPSGAYNDLLVETARGLGYEVIQWDCDSIDWKGYTADEICNKMEKKAGPGSITLFHSGAKHTAEALPRVIEYLKGEGYTILPVSEMIYWDNYEMDVQGRQHLLPKAPDSGETSSAQPEKGRN